MLQEFFPKPARNGRKSRVRRLVLEGLEDRWAPAGNLSVELSPFFPPTLQIRDLEGNHNSVRIGAGTSPGEIVVTGRNGTTLNGGTEPLTFTGVSQIFADLAGGNDTILVKDLSPEFGNAVTGLEVITGDGDDDIRIEDTVLSVNGPAFFASIFVASGFGDDSIRIEDTSLTGDFPVTIDIFGDEPGGIAGDDVIELDNVELLSNGGAANLNLNGDFGFFPGNTVGGDDRIELEDVTLEARGGGFFSPAVATLSVTGDSAPDAGDDDIEVQDVTVLADGPFGSIASVQIDADNSTFAGAASVANGNDEVSIEDVSVTAVGGQATFAITTDFSGSAVTGGRDELELERVFVVNGTTNIDTGVDNDEVKIEDSVFGTLSVLLGDGNDDLELEDGVIVSAATLDGGNGVDSLDLEDNIGTIVYLNFEDVEVD